MHSKMYENRPESCKNCCKEVSVRLVTEREIKFKPILKENIDKRIKCAEIEIVIKPEDVVPIFEHHHKSEFESSHHNIPVSQTLSPIAKYLIKKGNDSRRTIKLKINYWLSHYRQEIGDWCVSTKFDEKLQYELVEMTDEAWRLDIKISDVTAFPQETYLKSDHKETTKDPVKVIKLGELRLDTDRKTNWVYPRDNKSWPRNLLPEYCTAYLDFPEERLKDENTFRGHLRQTQKLNYNFDYEFTGYISIDLVSWISQQYKNFDHGYYCNPFLKPMVPEIPAFRVFQHNQPADLTINVRRNGSKIRCHTEYLAAASPYFCTLLHPRWNATPPEEINVDGISENAVKAMIQFIYFRDLESPIENWTLASELFIFASKHLMDELEDELSRLILVKPEDWFLMDVDALLETFMLLKNSGVCTEVYEKVERIWKCTNLVI